MKAIFLIVLKMSLPAALLALAVMVLRLALRRAPKKLVCLLWALVALRLLCPFSMESSLSLMPKPVADGQLISDFVERSQPEPPVQTVPEGHFAGNVPAENDFVFHEYQAHPVIPAKPDALEILTWIWTAGAGGMILYAAVSWLLLRRRMAEATLLSGNVWQCEKADSPFVLGLIFPKIYLPYGIRTADLGHVIAHEQAHISRGDHLWKPIGFLLLSVHWFNPVLWLAYLLLCRDIESACDEKVIGDMAKEEKQAYSTALLHCSMRRTAIAACPLAFGEIGVKQRIENVMGYKKPGFRIVMTAAIACAALMVCFLTNPPSASLEVLPLVHSHSYSVVEVTYESMVYDFSMVAQVNTPLYAISEDMVLRSQDELPFGAPWTTLGQLRPVELTAENFDDYFYWEEGWTGGMSPKSIRRNVANAWELIYGEEYLYYLLQMKNGELFLAYGYYDSTEKDDPGSDDTSIRWLYRLAVDLDQEYNIIARSGENEASVQIFPAGTAIANYKTAVHWLTIDPGVDFSPFRIYRNGEEVVGHYFAYDAETFEQLPYRVPSGLAPQTYLFQNADPEREYIVCAVFEAEQDADIYCFGVRFGERSDPALQNGEADDKIIMVPTDSRNTGVFDRYLYLTVDGAKYRYERQEYLPGGIQAGPQIDTVYEDDGLGNRYTYSVFSVKNREDNSMVLVLSEETGDLWLYRYSPAKAAAPGALQNAKDSGYVVMEDGDVTCGQEIWQTFWEKTRQGKAYSVVIAQYYTLDPSTCSEQYYEAYKEDYPSLYLQELYYDGETYTLREPGEETVRTFRYLMRYTEADQPESYTARTGPFVRFVLTNDNRVSWGDILNGMFSSTIGAYIDHYTVYTDME